MAKLNQRTSDAVAYLNEEATFGVDPATPTAIYPITETCDFAPDRVELENEELRSDLYDAQTSVQGLRMGTLKWSQYLRPDTTQLTSAVSVPAVGSMPWGLLPFWLAFGDQFPAAGAATIGDTASAATASTITVGSGAKFSKGTWILPTVSATTEPTRVINVVTNTLTIDPQCSTTASNAAVVQMYNFAPARSYSKSFAFRYAYNGDAGLQWLGRGCKMDSVEFELALGEIPKVTFSASVASWGTSAALTAPSALGYTITSGTNGMRAPSRMLDCYLIVQAATGTSAARAAHFSVEKCAVKLSLGTEYVPDLGGTEGKAGVMRVAARDFAEMTFTTRPEFAANVDTVDGYWSAQTQLQVVLLVPQGAGATKAWHVFDVPTCFVKSKPKYGREGGRLVQEWTVRSKRSAVVTSPTEGNSYHYAPFVYAVG